MPLTTNTAIVKEAIGETYTRLHKTLVENEMVSTESESGTVYLSD